MDVELTQPDGLKLALLTARNQDLEWTCFPRGDNQACSGRQGRCSRGNGSLGLFDKNTR
jgi:hypothetical protein